MERTSNLCKKLQLYRSELDVLHKYNRFYFIVIRILNIYHCALLPISSYMLSSPKMICFYLPDMADTPL
jgi:hypothetical protein